MKNSNAAAAQPAVLLNKNSLHCMIALFLGLFVWFFLPAAGGLTQTGVNVLAVTLATLYLWLTVNTSWCALLFLALLCVSGAMTPNQVWAGSLGHFAVITMVVFSILNYALKENGVIDKVAVWFITRKIARNRPYVFLGMFFLSNLFIGMFVDNLSLAVIYVGLARALADKIGLKKGSPFYSCMFIGILWCNVIISIASPIAHAPVLILIGMLETQLGISISYAQWLAIGTPFALLMFLVMMAAVLIWKPDARQFLLFDLEKIRREDKARPLSGKGRTTGIVFLACVAAILLPEILKGVFPSVFGYASSLGVVVPAIFAVCLLSFLTEDGEPVLDIRKAMNALPLTAIIFAGTVCVMSAPFSAENTGISLWLPAVLKPAFSGLSPVLIVICLTLLALFMTNFLSNVVTMVIFFNIGIALLEGSPVSLAAYAIAIGFASSMAALTPSACAPAPLLFGPEHVTVRSVLKPNLVFILLSFAVILLLVYPLAKVFIG